eukprot:4316752-Amphidinium_carterae.2
MDKPTAVQFEAPVGLRKPRPPVLARRAAYQHQRSTTIDTSWKGAEKAVTNRRDERGTPYCQAPCPERPLFYCVGRTSALTMCLTSHSSLRTPPGEETAEMQVVTTISYDYKFHKQFPCMYTSRGGDGDNRTSEDLQP